MQDLNRTHILLAFLLLLLPGLVLGKEAIPMAKDPVIEAKVMEISHELRCLVCQNQTIADSSAPLAIDLKREVRKMVKEGKGRDEVVDYMTERYGDFVRYSPAFKPSTAVLWIAPGVLLIGGVLILFFNILKRRKGEGVNEAAQLSTEEHSRAAALLDDDVPGGEKKA